MRQHQHTSIATLATALALLRFDDLRELKIVNNRVTLSRWIRNGNFPAPVRIGENTIAWRADDVKAWLDKRAQAQGLTVSQPCVHG